MPKYFGTDGIRGVANQDLTPDLALKIGKSLGYILSKSKKFLIIVGKDTRISSDMLEYALCAGATSVGCSIQKTGVIPTPAIPYLVVNKKVAGGVMISASHNPYPDNGIKIWGEDGEKLSEKLEEKIEKYLEKSIPLAPVKNLGKIISNLNFKDYYLKYLKGTISVSLDDFKIVVDCANGSASEFAPPLFSFLGAKVLPIHFHPDGLNINRNCGSLYPKVVRSFVIKNNADIGISLDGDADRATLIDNKGNILTGDHILAILALHYKKNNKLKNNTIVATVMSNIGLEILLKEKNIEMIRCPVGDKHVLSMMKKYGAIVGGEQAGHIIFVKYNTSSDGMFTALQIMQIMKKENKKLSELAGVLKTFPQVIVNSPVKNKNKLKDNKKIQTEIKKIENEIKGNGRLLVRPSGTENLIRVMIEGEDKDKIKNYAYHLKALIEKKL